MESCVPPAHTPPENEFLRREPSVGTSPAESPRLARAWRCHTPVPGSHGAHGSASPRQHLLDAGEQLDVTTHQYDASLDRLASPYRSARGLPAEVEAAAARAATRAAAQREASACHSAHGPHAKDSGTPRVRVNLRRGYTGEPGVQPGVLRSRGSPAGSPRGSHGGGPTAGGSSSAGASSLSFSQASSTRAAPRDSPRAVMKSPSRASPHGASRGWFRSHRQWEAVAL